MASAGPGKADGDVLAAARHAPNADTDAVTSDHSSSVVSVPLHHVCGTARKKKSTANRSAGTCSAAIMPRYENSRRHARSLDQRAVGWQAAMLPNVCAGSPDLPGVTSLCNQQASHSNDCKSCAA